MKNILKPTLFCLSLLLAQAGLAQSVWEISVIKVIKGHRKEALFYMEKTWIPMYEAALKAGAIKSYLCIETATDSVDNPEFVIMKEYADSAAYQRSDTAFNDIIMALPPQETRLLNNIQPKDFHEYFFSRTGRTLFTNRLFSSPKK